MVEQAMGQQTLALLRQLKAAAQAEDELAEATRIVFQQHPEAAIFTSFPGLGEIPSASVPAEIGDDPSRFAHARGLKAYAGAAPVTPASRKKAGSPPRTIKNRLAAVDYLWTFAALRLSTGARAHDDRRRIACAGIRPHNARISSARAFVELEAGEVSLALYTRRSGPLVLAGLISAVHNQDGRERVELDTSGKILTLGVRSVAHGAKLELDESLHPPWRTPQRVTRRGTRIDPESNP